MTWWTLALLGAVAAPAAPAAPRAADTVLTVGRGEVLVGDGLSLRVTVETWGRDEIELVEEGRPGRVGLRREGGRVVLSGDGPRARGAIRLRVPAWLPVQLRGVSLDASVDGSAAVVDLRSVDGDLTLRNVAGVVFAHTVEGEVVVSDARGRLRLRSVNEGVRVTRAVAEALVVESTSGDLFLSDVDAATVDASTTDGDIDFGGSLRGGGRYRLATHDGDITVRLPADADATVSVSTFDGDFLPQFPVRLERYLGGREMTFTLGRGAARLELSAFDGDIRLLRR